MHPCAKIERRKASGRAGPDGLAKNPDRCGQVRSRELIALRMDARADTGHDPSSAQFPHGLDGSADDPCHQTTPSRVGHTDHSLRTRQRHRGTVGSENSQARVGVSTYEPIADRRDNPARTAGLAPRPGGVHPHHLGPVHLTQPGPRIWGPRPVETPVGGLPGSVRPVR